MRNSEPAVWPPTAAQLAWRPEGYAFDALVPLTSLAPDGVPPAWLDVPAGADLDELELPAVTLAAVLLDRGSISADGFWVQAVEDRDGRLRIVVRDQHGTVFVPPAKAYARTLTLGELLEVIDETGFAGDRETVGVGHAVRERCCVEGVTRAELEGVVAMLSRRYPMLPALDWAREAAWVAGQV